MYHRNSITFSNQLLKAFEDGTSKETAFGLQRALAFANHLLMMPHIISNDFTPTDFVLHERRYFHNVLGDGLELREKLSGAHRITTFLNFDCNPQYPEAHIYLVIQGHQKGRTLGVQFQLEALFHHRFGLLKAIGWRTAEGHISRLLLDLCPDCHERSTPLITLAHHNACPRLTPNNYALRFEYDRGANDGYGNRDQQAGGPSYNLGYDIGGLTYQADLALGRITPSM